MRIKTQRDWKYLLNFFKVNLHYPCLSLLKDISRQLKPALL